MKTRWQCNSVPSSELFSRSWNNQANSQGRLQQGGWRCNTTAGHTEEQALTTEVKHHLFNGNFMLYFMNSLGSEIIFITTMKSERNKTTAFWEDLQNMSRFFTVHYISLSYLASNGISLTSVAQGFPPAKHLNPSRRSMTCRLAGCWVACTAGNLASCGIRCRAGAMSRRSTEEQHRTVKNMFFKKPLGIDHSYRKSILLWC